MTFLIFSLALLVASQLADALPAKRQLAQVITQCTVANTAALTFDDGPYLYTDEVANALTAAGGKGTFFFNGNNYGCIYSADNVKRVQDVYSQGHQVGSHTWSHVDLAKLGPDELNSEFSRVDEAFQRILGVTASFVRPPYGSYNEQVQTLAAAHGQKLALWDFDSGDSTGSTAAQSNDAYDKLVAQHPATILALNHEVYESSAHTVIPHAISVLQAKGYKLVTLAECVGLPAYQNVTTPQTGTFSC